MCSGIKVTCSFMMNCHAIIRINVCNWVTHLQPEWQTMSYWPSHIYSVWFSACCFVHPHNYYVHCFFRYRVLAYNKPRGKSKSTNFDSLVFLRCEILQTWHILLRECSCSRRHAQGIKCKYASWINKISTQSFQYQARRRCTLHPSTQTIHVLLPTKSNTRQQLRVIPEQFMAKNDILDSFWDASRVTSGCKIQIIAVNMNVPQTYSCMRKDKKRQSIEHSFIMMKYLWQQFMTIFIFRSFLQKWNEVISMPEPMYKMTTHQAGIL